MTLDEKSLLASIYKTFVKELYKDFKYEELKQDE